MTAIQKLQQLILTIRLKITVSSKGLYKLQNDAEQQSNYHIAWAAWRKRTRR